MDLKTTLPNLDDLDIEVTKNYNKLSDIFLAHVNKRIQIVNLLCDDLDEWVRLQMKGKSSWEVVRKGLAEGYPKMDKRRLMTKFSGDACSFWLWIYLQKKSRRSLGLIIEVSPFINWYVGQWDSYGKRSTEIIFKLDDYKKMETNLKKQDETLDVEIAFTGTEYESNDTRNMKFIGLSVEATKLTSQSQILHYHDLFKSIVLEPLFEIVRGI